MQKQPVENNETTKMEEGDGDGDGEDDFVVFKKNNDTENQTSVSVVNGIVTTRTV